MEIWKDIPGFEGRYQVSDLGRVKSFVSTFNGVNVKSMKERILKPLPSGGGYVRVRLTNGGNKGRFYLIHRLVMIAFVGGDAGKLQVNHINGNKTDNRLQNLEWASQSENVHHAYKHGLMKPCDNGLKKRIAALRDGEVIGEFDSMRDMCRALGLDRRSVQRTMSGRYANHHGLTFKEVGHET